MGEFVAGGQRPGSPALTRPALPHEGRQSGKHGPGMSTPAPGLERCGLTVQQNGAFWWALAQPHADQAELVRQHSRRYVARVVATKVMAAQMGRWFCVSKATRVDSDTARLGLIDALRFVTSDTKHSAFVAWVLEWCSKNVASGGALAFDASGLRQLLRVVPEGPYLLPGLHPPSIRDSVEGSRIALVTRPIIEALLRDKALESAQIRTICCTALARILRPPDEAQVQTAEVLDEYGDTTTVTNIQHSASHLRDFVVQERGVEALLRVLNAEKQQERQGEASELAARALRVLASEDTSSSQGRRLVGALAAQPWCDCDHMESDECALCQAILPLLDPKMWHVDHKGEGLTGHEAGIGALMFLVRQTAPYFSERVQRGALEVLDTVMCNHFTVELTCKHLGLPDVLTDLLWDISEPEEVAVLEGVGSPTVPAEWEEYDRYQFHRIVNVVQPYGSALSSSDDDAFCLSTCRMMMCDEGFWNSFQGMLNFVDALMACHRRWHDNNLVTADVFCALVRVLRDGSLRTRSLSDHECTRRKLLLQDRLVDEFGVLQLSLAQIEGPDSGEIIADLVDHRF